MHLKLQNDVEARTGFEPVNDGFANRSLRPLGYRASQAPHDALLYTGESINLIQRASRCARALNTRQRTTAEKTTLTWSVGGALL